MRRAWLVHAVGDLLARVEDLEVLHGVAAQLGIGGRALGARAALADDQLFGADVDGAVLQHVRESAGAQDRRRERPGLAIEIRDQRGAFQGEPRLGVQAATGAIARLVPSFHPPTVTCKPARDQNIAETREVGRRRAAGCPGACSRDPGAGTCRRRCGDRAAVRLAWGAGWRGSRRTARCPRGGH